MTHDCRCSSCGAAILPLTADLHGGKCIPCSYGGNYREELERRRSHRINFGKFDLATSYYVQCRDALRSDKGSITCLTPEEVTLSLICGFYAHWSGQPELHLKGYSGHEAYFFSDLADLHSRVVNSLEQYKHHDEARVLSKIAAVIYGRDVPSDPNQRAQKISCLDKDDRAYVRKLEGEWPGHVAREKLSDLSRHIKSQGLMKCFIVPSLFSVEAARDRREKLAKTRKKAIDSRPAIVSALEFDFLPLPAANPKFNNAAKQAKSITENIEKFNDQSIKYYWVTLGALWIIGGSIILAKNPITLANVATLVLGMPFFLAILGGVLLAVLCLLFTMLEHFLLKVTGVSKIIDECKRLNVLHLENLESERERFAKWHAKHEENFHEYSGFVRDYLSAKSNGAPLEEEFKRHFSRTVMFRASRLGDMNKLTSWQKAVVDSHINKHAVQPYPWV